MANVLVIGAGGQLGQCLREVVSEHHIENIIFPAEKTADILNEISLHELFKIHQPQYVINCAAYTAVDLAEEEIGQAQLVNEIGVALLASVCQGYEATLIHISTDFVFRGDTVKLLKEEDLTQPVNVYGTTKLAGEKAVASILKRYFIIRTSWLYSQFGNNFVKTMLRLAETKSELNIIADQVGTPTYAIDLAHAIFNIIEYNQGQYGIYHYSNEGVTSWFDFAQAVFDISGTGTKVNPIPGSAYPTKAKRPAFSVMNKTKIKTTFNIEIPYWRDSLIDCISKIKK